MSREEDVKSLESQFVFTSFGLFCGSLLFLLTKEFHSLYVPIESR